MQARWDRTGQARTGNILESYQRWITPCLASAPPGLTRRGKWVKLMWRECPERSKGRVVSVVRSRRCAGEAQEMTRWRDGKMARWRVDEGTGKQGLDMQRRTDGIVILNK